MSKNRIVESSRNPKIKCMSCSKTKVRSSFARSGRGWSKECKVCKKARLGDENANGAGRPRIWDDPEEMLECAKRHISERKQNETPITISGMAIALGYSDRHGLWDAEKLPKFAHTIKTIKAMVADQLECYSIEGRGAGPIFLLKNIGYEDKQAIEHSGFESVRLELPRGKLEQGQDIQNSGKPTTK